MGARCAHVRVPRGQAALRGARDGGDAAEDHGGRGEARTRTSFVSCHTNPPFFRPRVIDDPIRSFFSSICTAQVPKRAGDFRGGARPPPPAPRQGSRTTDRALHGGRAPVGRQALQNRAGRRLGRRRQYGEPTDGVGVGFLRMGSGEVGCCKLATTRSRQASHHGHYQIIIIHPGCNRKRNFGFREFPSRTHTISNSSLVLVQQCQHSLIAFDTDTPVFDIK